MDPVRLYKWILFLAASASVLSLASCVSIPEGATAVSPFDQQKYLGKWYEIARFDFKFERNLNNVTATYSLNSDGSIRVENRGFDTVKKEWKEAVGKAKFVKDSNLARLKVSFFGPFYAGYNVIALDPDYQYALIAGNNLDYLWILSRTTSIPDKVKSDYLERARRLGYDTNRLLWPSHSLVKDSD